jgi:hypothetical protein
MLRSLVCLALSLCFLLPAYAAEPDKPAAKKSVDAKQEAIYKRFEEMLAGVKLTGQFTIVGKEAPKAQEESYEIRSVKRGGDDTDLWLFDVKYAGKEMVMPLPVKFAGNCPVVHMNEFTIPGLGTFSCNVVFDGDRYAGTWSHGPVKGHLWGTIAKAKKE